MAPKKAERVHTHKPVKARPTGDPPPTKKDPTVERLRQLQVWQVAYCKDVSKPLSHKIVHRGLAEGVTMCGRAYTVEGPDVYIDGLERISPGEVYVHAGCNDSDSVFSPGWTHAYLGPRGAAGAVIDGGVYKSYECHKAACPVFSRFTSPSVATNLPSAPSIGKPVTIVGRARARTRERGEAPHLSPRPAPPRASPRLPLASPHLRGAAAGRRDH